MGSLWKGSSSSKTSKHDIIASAMYPTQVSDETDAYVKAYLKETGRERRGKKKSVP